MGVRTTSQPSAEIADFAVIGTHLALGFSGRVTIERHTLLMRPAATATLATPADALAYSKVALGGVKAKLVFD